MPSANYVLLEKITVGAAGASSVSFTGIPQTGYTDLVVKVSARDGASSVIDGATVRFNNDTTSGNYTARRLIGSGSAASSDTNNVGAFAVGNTATANTFSNCEFYIPNYTGSSYKSVSFDNVAETNATTQYMGLAAFLWSNTAAITSIQISGESSSFLQYSTFYLYGVAALGTTPAIVPYATGGDTIMTDGTYWYHTFLSSGTFTPQKSLSADYLVVAGGGGGGCNGGNYGGGGGAGGLRSTVTATGGGGSLESALSLASGTGYTVTIGAGGNGGNPTATKGSDTTFATITAAGGGFGNANTSASNGGSGGGGDGIGGGPGTGTTNQGRNGGNGDATVGGRRAGGGGGGANTAGANALLSSGAAGGAGVATSITGSSVTYAGGGGGGAQTNAPFTGTGGAGGAGGGGAGTVSGTAGNGTANLGAGGGGAGFNNDTSTVGVAGAGGSGLVIVRYAV
jgi:hypothetical protein